jgi:hypothetical protein
MTKADVSSSGLLPWALPLNPISMIPNPY